MAQVWTAMKYKDEVTQLQKTLEMQVKNVEEMMLRSAADRIFYQLQTLTSFPQHFLLAFLMSFEVVLLHPYISLLSKLVP